MQKIRNLILCFVVISFVINGCSKTEPENSGDSANDSLESKQEKDLPAKATDNEIIVKNNEQNNAENAETQAPAFEETKIALHLEKKIAESQNLLYCATIQLAWNEMKKLLGGDVKLVDAPPDTEFLNKSLFKKEYLDEKDYIAMQGSVKNGIVEKINNKLAEKFPGLDYRFNPEDTDPEKHRRIYFYAFLYKILEFDVEFEKIESLNFNDEKNVKAFGMKEYNETTGSDIDWKRRDNIKVRYYKSKDNFIVELKTKSENDELILAKIQPEHNLLKTYKKTEELLDTGFKEKTEYIFKTLRVPNISIDIRHVFKEFINKDIINLPGWWISKAEQLVKFNLNEKGAKLMEEGSWAADCIIEEPVIMECIFDKPFLVYLKKKDAPLPYFAAWIGNSDLLEPAIETPKENAEK